MSDDKGQSSWLDGSAAAPPSQQTGQPSGELLEQADFTTTTQFPRSLTARGSASLHGLGGNDLDPLAELYREEEEDVMMAVGDHATEAGRGTEDGV